MYLYILVYMIKLVLKLNDIEFVCTCCYISQIQFSTYSSEGIQFTKVNILSSESLLYKICNCLFKCL